MGTLTDVQIRNWIKAGSPVAVSDGDGLTFTLSKKGAAVFALRYSIAGKRKERTRTVAYGSGRASRTTAGRLSLTIPPSRAAKAALKRTRRLGGTVMLTFQATDDAPARHSRSFIVTTPRPARAAEACHIGADLPRAVDPVRRQRQGQIVRRADVSAMTRDRRPSLTGPR